MYVVVLNQVDADTHLWLSVLGKDLTEQSVMQILSACKSYVELDKKRLVDSTMSVLMQSNRALFVELKGADAMCKEFFEIFEPEINALIDERTKDITASVTFSPLIFQKVFIFCTLRCLRTFHLLYLYI